MESRDNVLKLESSPKNQTSEDYAINFEKGSHIVYENVINEVRSKKAIQLVDASAREKNISEIQVHNNQFGEAQAQ